MIAKVSRRVEGGKFSRLAAYVSDQKKIGNLRDWRKTADYILDKEGGGGRVSAIRISNCENEEPGVALAEIANVQERSAPSKTDKTYHLIVSFPPGEVPTQAQIHDIEDRLCEAIGLADHQRISAIHNDKDHFHFHVAINKVHPVTLKVVTPYFDHPRLQAACVELEKKHRLTPTNHQMPDRGMGKKGGRDDDAMEWHGGQQSLRQWVRDEAGTALLNAAETGTSWEVMHRAAASYGLEIKPRGAGLVIAVIGDKYARVKPSDIDRRLSYSSLTARWGAFQPPRGPMPAPEKVYPKAALHIRSPKTAGLFKEYQAQQAEAKAHRARTAEWIKARREVVRSLPLTKEGRVEAREELNKIRSKAQEAAPLQNWQDWLRTSAANGDMRAAEILRSAAGNKARLGAAVLSASDISEARHVVYQHLHPTVDRHGAMTYHVADGGQVTDQAAQVRVDKVSVAATLLAVTLAADRFGERPLVITGTDEFKAQVAQVAAIEGLDVRFADPDMEKARLAASAQRAAEVERRASEPQYDRGQAPPIARQVAPEVEAFIAERNGVRNRVADVLPHRIWTPSDAGAATYGGRRSLKGGGVVLLLQRNGETLVRPVSDAQWRRAATWSIGDRVELASNGRSRNLAAAPSRPAENTKGGGGRGR